MINAYLDSLSVHPGDCIRVHASELTARLSVRQWFHSDPHALGPGVRVNECEWGSGEVAGDWAPTSVGSWIHAPDVLTGDADFTVSAWILPTDLSLDSAAISWHTLWGTLTLEVAARELVVRLSRGDEVQTVRSAQRVTERQWSFVGLVVNAREGRITMFSAPWGRTGGPFVSDSDVDGARIVPDRGELFVGRDAGGSQGSFDGHIAGLRVHARALDIVELMDVMNGLGFPADHEWQFDDRSDPDTVPSVSSGTSSMALMNAPAWSALAPPPVDSEGRPLTLPGSVHLHRDDVEDCDWPVVADVVVPIGAPTGVYTLCVTTAEEQRELPFVVMGTSRVVLQVPTLTWQAYGNLGRDPEHWPGRSHYSLHSDGSAVIVTTSRRPCDTFSPHARLEVDGHDGFAGADVVTHLLMADLYAWQWLVAEGVGPALIDDRELHLAGIEALEGVDVLVLSAHPEYWTTQMLDALQTYLDRGGSVIYLGGNGLYWVTSLHPTKPHLMEVRRWGGSQTCSVAENDRIHQFESVQGGLWAEAGRPPNAMVRVGFTGFGAGPSLEFERTDASYSPEWAWAFDGVETSRFGAEGINAGAGNEYDRVDLTLPSPGPLTVLASAVPQTPDHFGAFEYGLARAPHPSVRADMIATATESGGMVFSTSAVSVSGCLIVEDADAPMKRVVSNVLRRMLDNQSHDG